MIKRNREYSRKRRQNVKIRLSRTISRLISFSLNSKNSSKDNEHWEDIVKFTIQEFIEHLEKQFLPGMTWKNRGGKNGWHIDHIIPIRFFDYKSMDDIEFRMCWSLNNLQPLWKKDNLEKGDKITLWGKEINSKNMERDYFNKIDSFHIDSSFSS